MRSVAAWDYFPVHWIFARIAVLFSILCSRWNRVWMGILSLKKSAWKGKRAWLVHIHILGVYFVYIVLLHSSLFKICFLTGCWIVYYIRQGLSLSLNLFIFYFCLYRYSALYEPFGNQLKIKHCALDCDCNGIKVVAINCISTIATCGVCAQFKFTWRYSRVKIPPKLHKFPDLGVSKCCVCLGPGRLGALNVTALLAGSLTFSALQLN